jgi:hypothetical protein
MYFVSAMGLVIYQVVTKAKVPRILLLAFLQAAPWLIMASGGRTARIALVLMLVVCLVDRRSRTTTLYVLPSSLIALAIGIWFQLLTNAVIYFWIQIQTTFPEVPIAVVNIWNQIQAMFPFLPSAKGMDLTRLEVLQTMNLKGRFFEDFERSQLI